MILKKSFELRDNNKNEARNIHKNNNINYQKIVAKVEEIKY